MKKKYALLLIPIAVVGLTFFVNLFFYKEKSEKYIPESSCKYLSKIAYSTVLNKETSLSEKELNDFLVKLCGYDFFISINNNNILKIIVPSSFNGFKVNLFCKANIFLEGQQLKIKIFDTKIGKISVNPKIFASFIKQTKISEDEIIVPAAVDFEILGVAANVALSKIEIDSNHVTIKTCGQLPHLKF